MKNNTINFLTKILLLITFIFFIVLGIQEFIKKESDEYRLKIEEKLVTFKKKIVDDDLNLKKILRKLNIKIKNINEIKQLYITTTELLIYKGKMKNLTSFTSAIAIVRKIKTLGKSKMLGWKIKEYLTTNELKSLNEENNINFGLKTKIKQEVQQIVDLINFNVFFWNIHYYKNEIEKLIID